MDVISSAKTTHLCTFPDFNTKFVYRHKEDEQADFQFFSHTKLFFEANNKNSLELLQIKTVKGPDDEICRLRKIRVVNLFCMACPKQENETVALGYSTGNINVLNYKTTEYITKFPAERNRNSVIFLDFNASDEHLASVYENGLINIYGLKTKVKLETLKFDNNSTLARFHPVKRFHLAVASYKGALTIYDVQGHRKLFTCPDAHKAPCRDICMTAASPDIIISAGYDCIVNLFDTRKKLCIQKIEYRHPLSTVALSDCGKFCCVGNLKGELISYDLRNLDKYLSVKKVHDTAVVRVAFVPQENYTKQSTQTFEIEPSRGSLVEMNSGETSVSGMQHSQNERKSTAKRDSFCDFLEFHSVNDKEKTTAGGNRYSVRRDSYDWEALERRNVSARFSSSGVDRFSLDGKSDARDSIDASGELVKCKSTEDLKVTTELIHNKSRSLSDLNDHATRLSHDLSNITFRRNNKPRTGELQEIAEERKDDDNAETHNVVENPNVAELMFERDNKHMNLSNRDIDYLRKLPDDKNSTPTNSKRPADIQAISDEIKSLRSHMDKKFACLESELNFYADQTKWTLINQNVNNFLKQMEAIGEIRECVGYLLQTDPFVNEFLQLKRENEQLKQKLLEHTKNNF